MSGFGQIAATNTRSGWRNPFEAKPYWSSKTGRDCSPAARPDSAQEAVLQPACPVIRTLTDQLSPRQIVVATAPYADQQHRLERRGLRSRGADLGRRLRGARPVAASTGAPPGTDGRTNSSASASSDRRHRHQAVVRHLQPRVDEDGVLRRGWPASTIARVRAQRSMLGADLAGEVSLPRAVCRRARRATRCFEVHRGRPRSWYQDQHSA